MPNFRELYRIVGIRHKETERIRDDNLYSLRKIAFEAGKLPYSSIKDKESRRKKLSQQAINILSLVIDDNRMYENNLENEGFHYRVNDLLGAYVKSMMGDGNMKENLTNFCNTQEHRNIIEYIKRLKEHEITPRLNCRISDNGANKNLSDYKLRSELRNFFPQAYLSIIYSSVNLISS